MVARFAGATLGLFAFAFTIAAGLLVRNPVEVTLSRSILALLVFCLMGFILGGLAQTVIAEHRKDCESKIRQPNDEGSGGTGDGRPVEETTDDSKAE